MVSDKRSRKKLNKLQQLMVITMEECGELAIEVLKKDKQKKG